MSAEITISKSLTISQSSRGEGKSEAQGTFAKEFEKQLTITTDSPELLKIIFEHLETLKEEDKEKSKTALEKLLEIFFGIEPEEDSENYTTIKTHFIKIASHECDCETIKEKESMRFLQKQLFKVLMSPMLSGFEDKTEDIKKEFKDNPTFNTTPALNLENLVSGEIDVASLIS